MIFYGRAPRSRAPSASHASAARPLTCPRGPQTWHLPGTRHTPGPRPARLLRKGHSPEPEPVPRTHPGRSLPGVRHPVALPQGHAPGHHLGHHHRQHPPRRHRHHQRRQPRPHTSDRQPSPARTSTSTRQPPMSALAHRPMDPRILRDHGHARQAHPAGRMRPCQPGQPLRELTNCSLTPAADGGRLCHAASFLRRGRPDRRCGRCAHFRSTGGSNGGTGVSSAGIGTGRRTSARTAGAGGQARAAETGPAGGGFVHALFRGGGGRPG
jgi:hypothetical protein